jgi:hypothetical protein
MDAVDMGISELKQGDMDNNDARLDLLELELFKDMIEYNNTHTDAVPKWTQLLADKTAN